MSVSEWIIPMIVFMGTVILSLYMMLIEATFFHELGHLHTARKYKYTEAVMRLKRAHQLLPLRDCKVIRGKSKDFDGTGRVDLKNNFLGYTEEQIGEIARAGVKYASIFCAVFGGICTLSMIIVYNLFYNPLYIVSAVYEIVITVLIIIWHYARYIGIGRKKTKDQVKSWRDIEIDKDRAGFIKFKEEEVRILNEKSSCAE